MDELSLETMIFKEIHQNFHSQHQINTRLRIRQLISQAIVGKGNGFSTNQRSNRTYGSDFSTNQHNRYIIGI